MSKVQCFYFSPTSNTKKIVEAVASGICEEKIENDLTFVDKNLDQYVVDSNEIAVIGVPVYGGRVPEVILDSLKRIKGNGAYAVAVVTYGNRAYEDSLLELKNILVEQNFKVVAAGAFIGEHSYTKKVATNRPDELDLKKAIDFGKDVVAKIKTNTNNITEPSIPGNYPYKERSKRIFSPHGNRKCVYCRRCPVVCPVGAIDMRKPDIVDEEKCIHCCASIKVFSFNGRELLDEWVIEKIKMLETNCIDRKEPEIFI